jgi:hypothetical protein
MLSSIHIEKLLSSIDTKHLTAIITVFLSVLLGAGSIASGEKTSVKKGKALFNDPELVSTGSSCNTCNTDGRGLKRAAKKITWIIGGKVHSTLEGAINYSIVAGLRGNAQNIESVEMQSLRTLCGPCERTALSKMEADNGAVAVEKLMRQDFNLLLIDLNMPELDRAGIIRAFRQ